MTTEQIAREAADQLHGIEKRPNPAKTALKEQTVAIILSAIERATESQPRQGSPESSEWECPECKTRYVSNVGNCGNIYCSRPEVVPVQRGEQQEWTGQTVFDIMGTDYGGDGWKREKLVADAHNAALATERQRHEKVIKDMVGQVRISTESLHQQLAAEREANRGLYIESNERYQQLSTERQRREQAELASDKVHAKGKNEGWNEGREHERKCQAEVRKPLVEALERIDSELGGRLPVTALVKEIARVALARVKEQ